MIAWLFQIRGNMYVVRPLAGSHVSSTGAAYESLSRPIKDIVKGILIKALKRPFKSLCSKCLFHFKALSKTYERLLNTFQKDRSCKIGCCIPRIIIVSQSLDS